jgi:hypothetical protein
VCTTMHCIHRAQCIERIPGVSPLTPTAKSGSPCTPCIFILGYTHYELLETRRQNTLSCNRYIYTAELAGGREGGSLCERRIVPSQVDRRWQLLPNLHTTKRCLHTPWPHTKTGPCRRRSYTELRLQGDLARRTKRALTRRRTEVHDRGPRHNLLAYTPTTSATIR